MKVNESLISVFASSYSNKQSVSFEILLNCNLICPAFSTLSSRLVCCSRNVYRKFFCCPIVNESLISVFSYHAFQQKTFFSLNILHGSWFATDELKISFIFAESRGSSVVSPSGCASK